MNHLRDGCLQCSNGAKVVLIDVSLRKPQRKKSKGLRSGECGAHYHLSFGADETLSKLFTEPCHGNISSVRRSTILLEPLFFLMKVLTLFDLSSELLKH